jgi:omega-amidase
MKVAAIQLDAVVADPEANLAAAKALISRAAHMGCDLVVLPEMIDTGYVMDDIARTADVWDGAFVPGLREVARGHGINIVVGVSERVGDDIFNAIAAIDREGTIVGHYRKVHLFSPAGEDQTCTAGDALVVCEFDDIRWGLAVCYDIRFPEMTRRLAFAGIKGLLVPSAFPFPRLDHWRVLLRARAMENQCFVVAANRVGTDGKLTFCGSSQVIDPYGTVVAAAGEIGEALATAEVELRDVDAVRSAIPAFSSTRPDVYEREIRNDVTRSESCLVVSAGTEAHG